MKISHCTFVLHTIVSCLNRHHLLLNPATYGWREDGFWALVWFEGNALPNAEELSAISPGSLKIDKQELNIISENESAIKDSDDEECVLSSDEPGANSDID